MIKRQLKRRIAAYQFRLKRIERIINMLAVFRFALFLGMVVGLSLAVSGDYRDQGGILLLVSTVLFLYLMVRHDRAYRFQSRLGKLQYLAEQDLARREHRFHDIAIQEPIVFEDRHPFAHDLDLSGTLSVLKQIDNSFHRRCKALLKRWLDHAETAEVIRERQIAVADLAPRKRCRAKLTLACHLDSVAELDASDMDAWLAMKTPWTLSLPAYIFGRLTALATVIVMVLTFGFGMELPWLAVLFGQILIVYGFDFVHKPYAFTFMARGKALDAAAAVIDAFETTPVRAPLLRSLRTKLSAAGSPATPHLRKLVNIHEMLQYRGNGLAHVLLNVTLMWDQHQLRRLDGWRGRYGSNLPDWIETVFQVEALSAIANFHALFPERPFPNLKDQPDVFLEAKNLAHPAITTDVRVGNDYSLTENCQLHLITGSNMSGKSTFLRAVGLNMVLARLGAPVCADQMTCSLPRIWTSIRIVDSLAEGVSYFYAEVQRLKAILDEVATDNGPVLYLMDEILKGTNSRERLIATKSLARFLIEHKASGLITTHDLEMLALSDDHPTAITNYHFQEQVRGDEMFFDYALRPGHLTSTNALRVMSLAKVPLIFEDDHP